MSSTEQAPEPTMDEILASIRRIIADDEAGDERKAETAKAPEDAPEPSAEAAKEEVAEASDGAEPSEAQGEDIFELTDALEVPPISEPQAEAGLPEAEAAASEPWFSGEPSAEAAPPPLGAGIRTEPEFGQPIPDADMPPEPSLALEEPSEPSLAVEEPSEPPLPPFGAGAASDPAPSGAEADVGVRFDEEAVDEPATALSGEPTAPELPPAMGEAAGLDAELPPEPAFAAPAEPALEAVEEGLATGLGDQALAADLAGHGLTLDEPAIESTPDLPEAEAPPSEPAFPAPPSFEPPSPEGAGDLDAAPEPEFGFQAEPEPEAVAVSDAPPDLSESIAGLEVESEPVLQPPVPPAVDAPFASADVGLSEGGADGGSSVIALAEPLAVAEEAAEPASEAAGPKSLEDAVKELLKPVLREWLDDNMARILESAARDELASNEAVKANKG